AWLVDGPTRTQRALGWLRAGAAWGLGAGGTASALAWLSDAERAGMATAWALAGLALGIAPRGSAVDTRLAVATRRLLGVVGVGGSRRGPAWSASSAIGRPRRAPAAA